MGGYLALLAIVIAAAQNVFGTDAFTRSACWFCIILILAVLGWGMYLLNKCDSKLRKVNKKINMTTLGSDPMKYKIIKNPGFLRFSIADSREI